MSEFQIPYKLTPLMLDALKKVVATNGGGYDPVLLNPATVQALYRRGLIQGKKGQQHLVVHTKLATMYMKQEGIDA